MPRIELSKPAEIDVAHIWAYIARDNPQAADGLIDKIDRRLQSLARMPESAESVPWVSSNARRSSVGKYVIYYRPIEDGIQVLRILHGARRPEDLL